MEKDNTYRKLEKDFAAIRDERGTQANTANRIGSAFLSLLSYIGSAAFLRKDVPDTAEQVITFLKGIVAKAVSYFQGIVNRGDIKNDGDITNTGNISNAGDITNSGNIMTNNLTVKGKATFFELEIQKAKAAGGMSVNSAGSFHIDAVKETEDGFECYQRAEKDGVKLSQTCEVSDQMMCSNGMNILEGGKGNHFYWRKATEAPKEVVMHTIDGKEEKCLKLVLSKTDHSKNTVDIPQVGDDLVQIGNPDNKERQSVMMSCAYNSFDPELKPSYWAHYVGVNDYDISKHRYTWFAANGSQVTGNFKVQSDNGGLESIEDYVKGLATKNSNNTVVWQVAFSIRQITDKQGETFRLKVVRIVGDKAEEVDYAAIIAAGADLLIFGDDMGTELRVNPGKDYLTAHYPHKRYLRARVVSSGTDITLAQDTIYTDVEDGKPGKDAVSYKLLPQVENAQAYFLKEDEKNTENTGKKKEKEKKIDIRLVYKIMKSVGEQVNFITNLIDEGMTLTIKPSVGEGVEFKGFSGIYGLNKSIGYAEIPNNSYVVTLTKGGEIVDQRIVPITFKPKVVFDIDTKNGEIRSDITNVKGDMNSFKATIKETSNTVGNLEKEFTQMKLTSKEVSFTVNNGTRPNLLWGSDLDLSEVQDKIILAHKQGDIIKQETTEKENLQRQLDATPTYDTAKRNDLQEKINACNDNITTVKKNVNECKAAIEKHLGVGLASTKIDSEEWFEYMKGGGVSGADAIKFKTMKDTSEFAGLFWEINAGAARNLQLKPNTIYTLSAWVRTEFDKDAQGYGVFAFEAFKKDKEDSAQRVGGLSFKTASSWFEPINEWTRVSTTFTTEELLYGSVAMWMNGTKPATLYICRPKLEEGDKATPWREYDRTADLERAILDIKSGEITLDAEKTTVKGDLTAKSLRTEGDPSKGGATIVAKGGMFTVYGVNKSVPGMEIGLNEAGEPVLKMYKNGKFMYDLGPDTIFEQVIERENAFTPCDMHRICNTAGNDMEKSFGGDFPSNYRKMVAYVFSEGYKRVGNQTRYKVSETNEISAYNGVYFAEQRSVSVITAKELESISRIADGWYLNGGGPRVSHPSEPAYDGSNPQGYTCRRFNVRFYSKGKATPRLGSFTVCGNSQTGWTVEKIDIPFL